MPIQSMQCPKCGHWATEYDINKWQCLKCHTKFVYETPPKPDALIQHAVSMDDVGIIYVCDICGLRFSRLTQPDQMCTACGTVTICPGCFSKPQKTCQQCSIRIAKESAKKWVGALITVMVLVFFAWNGISSYQKRINREVLMQEYKREREESTRKREEAEQESRHRAIQQEQVQQEQERLREETMKQRNTRLQEIQVLRGTLLGQQDEIRQQLSTDERRANYEWATQDDLMKFRETKELLHDNERAVRQLEDEVETLLDTDVTK